MVDVNSTFFIQMLNFFVLLIVLKKFAWGPLLKVLHDRTDKIANNIRQADEDRLQAAEMKKEYEQKLSEARKRAQEITDSATQRSEAERRARVEETQQEIEQMKSAAKAQIQAERDEAAKQMKGHMVALSLAAATKLMGKNMDDAANEALVGEFIDGLRKDDLGDLSC
ncbi:MAG: F0F1 ATP synthase subunit B [Schwartzia sp.]|nr:F0F1 ATP synthase subunit B [Schwartzia sp. (in: firmicutes)]